MNTLALTNGSRAPQAPSAFDRRLVLAALAAFVVCGIFSGPLRMVLSGIGLSPLIYVANLLVLAAIGWTAVREPLAEGFTALHLITLVIIGGAVCVGLQFTSPLQVGMGIWVLTPFWFGLVCGTALLRAWTSVRTWIPLLWLLATAGVLVNSVITWPWEGFGYSVAGLDVEGSRQWYAAGGIKRLAGFARSSFDAAIQVQVLGILTALMARRFLLRALIWGATAYAVYLTTTKGALLIWLALTPLVMLRTLVPESLLRPLPALFGSLGLGLCIAPLLFEFVLDRGQSSLMVNLTHSFYDRLNRMWPEAWLLIEREGHLLMGRGIGGIGTAQTYFESALFNAGDNLFMYWFVVFGWAALPGFLMLILRSLRMRPFRDETELVVYALLLATLVYGMTTNIVENALFAIICGLVVRWLGGTARNPAKEPS